MKNNTSSTEIISDVISDKLSYWRGKSVALELRRRRRFLFINLQITVLSFCYRYTLPCSTIILKWKTSNTGRAFKPSSASRGSNASTTMEIFNLCFWTTLSLTYTNCSVPFENVHRMWGHFLMSWFQINPDHAETKLLIDWISTAIMLMEKMAKKIQPRYDNKSTATTSYY